MSIESEIRARNIRAKLMAKSGKRSKPSTRTGEPTSSHGGDGINRAELWRKAMASQDAASLEEIDKTAPKTAGTQTNMVRSVGSHADMWRRAHERARLLPPIRSDE
jgi:hypothetical protein